ncbi:hypothetical protein COU75_00050 [Candidatus Peregrinibacteria bacterium CG10_big_fil_rev_8_21_14_0_10_42_8]|nr:MAG: hypothetical protein COU75_00050 [Candidatus Peregrinibacteria bacterium CG10_big_fil_rev_8_21_14_0_10_42_8]
MMHLEQFFIALLKKRKWNWQVWTLLGFILLAIALSNGDKVISILQFGGQAAHTIINATPPDRHLNDKIIEELKEKLSLCTESYVQVSNVLSDWEAYQLADDIKIFLQELNIEVIRDQDGDLIKPGISFECREARLVVQVGKNT